jgi:ABC-2 type transport system ATP-binding protein
MLELQQVEKKYHNQSILGPIQLSLPNGVLLGLLGPNGSGKTTLLKLIVGSSKLSGGKILWNQKIKNEASLSDIAFLPDYNPFPTWMNIQDAIHFYKLFYSDFNAKECIEYLDLFALPRKQKITHLSKGNLEKVKLIFTLARKAKLYLLDEPLEGIDISSRKKMMYLLAGLLNENCSIILSSHYVREMDQLFTDILILKKGKVALYGDKDMLQAEMNLSLEEIYEDIFREGETNAIFDSF